MRADGRQRRDIMQCELQESAAYGSQMAKYFRRRLLPVEEFERTAIGAAVHSRSEFSL